MAIREIIDATTGVTVFASDCEQEVLAWYQDAPYRRVFHWYEVGTAYTDMRVRADFRLLYQSRDQRGELWVVPISFADFPL